MASEPYFTREEGGLLSQLEIGFRTLSRRYHLVREPAQVAPECLHKNVRDLGVRLDALQRHRHGALGAVRDNAERWGHSGPAAQSQASNNRAGRHSGKDHFHSGHLSEGDCLFID
jgi:hypothetical protein